MSTLDGGQRVGRYRIVRFLGAGAMGEVYLAEDPHIERQLAIKTVRVAGGRPQDIEDRKKRLLREARAAGRLLHPNIVTLFDTGEEDGLLYLAFEFVEGCDLASRLEAREPPSLREVLRTVRQVAEALDYAHRQGIVHRDIKPSNILIDPAGRVKVADFGIAKVVGQNTELTVAGSVMGSPQYLSPEQIRGDELDGRSDIFSLGVVLYELLSGRRPFDGETITTLVYQILNKDVSISDLRMVPLRLEQLLHRMLAKDRDDRLATASQVGEELAAIERELSEETLAAPAAPAPESMDATRVLPSRALAVGAADAPGATPPAGSSGAAAAPGAPGAPIAAAGGPIAAPGGVISESGRIGAIPGGVVAGPAAAGPGGAPPAVAPPAAAAAPRRSSSAKVWLALAAILLVICGALAAGAYMVWKRYLQGAAAQVAAASQPAAAASPSDRGAATPAPAGPSVPPGGTAGSAAAGAGSASPSSNGQAPGSGAAPGPGATPASPGAAPSGAGGTRPDIVVTQPSAAASARADRTPSQATATPRRAGTTVARSGSSAEGERAAPPATATAASGRSGRSSEPGGSSASGGANVSGGAAGQPAAEEGEAAAAPASSSAVGNTESVDRVIHSGLELAFRVNPPDAYVLLDGAVIGRAEEWNGQRGGRAFTLPGTGPHLVKIKKQGMKDYRITVEAAATRGTTPVVVSLQPLPTAQVDTSDLQTIRVREAVALRVQPDVNALVLVDGATVGPVKKFGGRFGHGDEWLGLPLGMHRLTLVAPGYGRRDLAVEISPGADKARQKIDVTLTPAGATGNP